MRELPLPAKFRLEDLQMWHLVEALCRCCGHRALVPHALLRRRSPFTRLGDLEASLRCRKCGARGRHKLSLRLMARE